MTVPRRVQISLEQTPYYHCTTRCVRRAFLCGDDAYSGRNYDHRKRWMEQRLKQLSAVFAIELLAYAVMSNHYHVVVRLNPAAARRWSDDEVCARWERVFSVPRWRTPERIATWRERLQSLSWYMRCLNEPLARRANREDNCTGRFWEGRYRCRSLLDEGAVLQCMVYVDLNPVSADVARTPEASAFTSVYARIRQNDSHLAPFADQPTAKIRPIPYSFRDYLALLDWTGRQLRTDKRGRIAANAPPILDRLDRPVATWVAQIDHYDHWYFRAVGSIDTLHRYCNHLGQQWLRGMRAPAVAGL